MDGKIIVPATTLLIQSYVSRHSEAARGNRRSHQPVRAVSADSIAKKWQRVRTRCSIGSTITDTKTPPAFRFRREGTRRVPPVGGALWQW